MAIKIKYWKSNVGFLIWNGFEREKLHLPWESVLDRPVSVIYHLDRDKYSVTDMCFRTI